MIVCFPLFFISPDRFKTDSGEFRTERIVEIFTRLRLYSKRSDLEQLMECSRKNIKVQFSSECKVRVFANCSKNQNKVLKCIFKSSWVLGFAKYWGLCKKKIPHGWGNTGTLKCTISKVPTSARCPPPPPPGKPMTSA